ncbi:hypothetical protein [Niallia oryzisoli]|uniref:hypothetical protein n=1 Tax=Niallia oryzisoli TaxID=1737571 RepID=UPI003736926E
MENEEQKDSNTEEQDPFTRLMFGSGRSSQPQQNDHEDRNRPVSNENNQLNELLSNVNVDELMKNIDTLVSNASHFKPILNKLGPLINKWIK